MGFYGFLDIKNGKTISIDNEHGLNVGNPLAAFLSTYMSYDLEGLASEEDYPWFARLESQTNVPLRLLVRCFYAGEWDYKPDEYAKYLEAWGSVNVKIMSEEEFKQYLLDLERTWTPIDAVIEAVGEMNRILPSMGEDTYWFTAEDTLPAFQALLKNLTRAKENGGEEVRIQFI
jgi:hypothetical protein